MISSLLLRKWCKIPTHPCLNSIPQKMFVSDASESLFTFICSKREVFVERDRNYLWNVTLTATVGRIWREGMKFCTFIKLCVSNFSFPGDTSLFCSAVPSKCPEQTSLQWVEVGGDRKRLKQKKRIVAFLEWHFNTELQSCDLNCEFTSYYFEKLPEMRFLCKI